MRRLPCQDMPSRTGAPRAMTVPGGEAHRFAGHAIGAVNEAERATLKRPRRRVGSAGSWPTASGRGGRDLGRPGRSGPVYRCPVPVLSGRTRNVGSMGRSAITLARARGGRTCPPAHTIRRWWPVNCATHPSGGRVTQIRVVGRDPGGRNARDDAARSKPRQFHSD